MHPTPRRLALALIAAAALVAAPTAATVATAAPATTSAAAPSSALTASGAASARLVTAKAKPRVQTRTKTPLYSAAQGSARRATVPADYTL